ncbi:MAG: hypothetical protein AAF211_16945, partial [Myxococcota bacterium]
LKQGRFLSDDPTGAFLPANQLPTGDRRLLSSVAVYAPSRDEVTVVAGDRAFGQLIVTNYLVPCPEGASTSSCEAPGPEVTSDVPSGVQVDVKRGWTTSEDWTFTPTEGPDGREWAVEGSRSGLQPTGVRPSELPWSAEDRRLQVDAIPPANAEAAAFTIRTELPGLREIDVGGVPLALEMATDQSWLALVVRDSDTDVVRLAWLDPTTLGALEDGDAAALVDVTLPAGAEPHRLSVSEEGGLLVADASRAAYYEVPFGTDNVVEHATPWPTLDVAGLRLESGNPDTDVRFLVPLDGGSLWRHDPVSGELLDVNPAQPGPQGISFDAPVQGIEAMPWPFRSTERDNDEERTVTRAVAVSLSDGRVVFAHEDTGCLVQDEDGPETNLVTRAGSASTDINTAEIPAEAEFTGRFTVRLDGEPNRVTVNACAGIAKPETWAATFDQNLGTWEVEGSLSGPQVNRVVEDQRYVTDDGAVSFLLRSGEVPSFDGWAFSFSVDSGVATANGDGEGDGIREGDLSGSGDPVFFFYRVGKVGPVSQRDLEERPPGQEDLFYNPNIRPFVLVPGGATNRVSRVNPSLEFTPVVEVSWN